MNDRALIATGGIGSVIAAICCFTPLLAVMLLAVILGAVGLTAWLAKADYVLFPVLFVCLGLLALGLYHRYIAAQRPESRPRPQQGAKS